MDRIPDNLLAAGPFNQWELVIKESFKLKELYKRLYHFLIDEEFVDLHLGKDVFETFYREKDNGDGTTDHKIWWRAAKIAKNDAHKNIKFYIALDIKTVRMQSKEVIINGKKEKLDNGEIEFKYAIYIDFENNTEDKKAFTNHWLLKHFKKKFWTRWHRVPRDQAYAEAMVFSSKLHNFIQVYTGATPPSPDAPRDRWDGTDVNIN